MSEKYLVYMHINKINGKKYVGITSYTLVHRSGEFGQRYKSCTHFYNAVQKYGWANFRHEILVENLSKEQAINLEISLIDIFNLNNPKYGYNITSGGEGSNNFHHSNEFKEQMVLRWKNEDYRQKMIEMNCKKVICLETKKIFNSCQEAAIEVSRASSNISACCRKEVKSCGKDKDGKRLHWMFYDEYLIATDEEIANAIKPDSQAKVIKCVNTGEIFPSISSAEKKYNIKSKGGIMRVVKGERNYCGIDANTGEKLKWELISDNYVKAMGEAESGINYVSN